MNAANPSDVLKRLESVEWQNRLIKRGIVVVALVISISFLAGAHSSTMKVLEAQKLVLSGSDGKPRCQIEVDSEGNVTQTFSDKTGSERIRLFVDSAGVARFRLIDDKGSIRVFASSFPDGATEGAGRAALGVLGYGNGKGDFGKGGMATVSEKDGTVRQIGFDKEGTMRYVNSTEPDGLAAQTFYDKKGTSRIVAGTFPEGNAMHVIADLKGTPRIAASTFPNGMASNWLYDHDAVLRVDSSTYPDGAMIHSLFDKNKKERVLLATLPNGESGYSVMGKDGTTKSSTTVRRDDTVTHYLERSALETAWNIGSVLLNIHQLYELAK